MTDLISAVLALVQESSYSSYPIIRLPASNNIVVFFFILFPCLISSFYLL